MTNISYNYEIVNVNPAARSMEIVYTSEGRPPVHMGARLPYVGESLEGVVQMFAPVAYWREQDAAVDVPTAGSAGMVSPPAPPTETLDSVKKDKKAEIANWRYEKETSGVIFNGSKIETDRVSQASVTAAYTSLKDGLVQSIDWKTARGTFITLTLAEVTAISVVVAQHVQSCFTLERQYCDQVDAAQTIDAVKAITLPAINTTIPVTTI